MAEAVVADHAGEEGAGTPDPFGGRAAKLAVLLGLDRPAAVLAIGNRWRDWRDDLRAGFAKTHFVQTTAMLRVAPGTIGLALVDGDALATLSREALEQVMRTLTPSGSLLLVARNRLALRPFVRQPKTLLARGVATRWRYHRLLRQAGATRIEEFLPFPRLWDAEEMIADRHSITLPSHASRVERLLLASALLPALHEGFVFIASRGDGGTMRLRAALANGLGQPAGRVAIDRFDLRGRGALVLMLRCGEERLVCRVTTSRATTDRVRRNAEWLRRVDGWPALPGALRRLLPAQRDVIALGAGIGYTERRVDGIVAWKLAGIPRLEEVLRRALHDFARDLARATAHRVTLDHARLSELLNPQHVAGDAEASARADAVRSALRARWTGRTAHVVIAHGDYGYGNAIATPDGALAGVIDWDQGRFDLAGVDLVNFLVQRVSGMHALAPVDAFRRVAEQWKGGGPRGVDARLDMADDFPEIVAHGPTLLAWTALRYVERAMSYPALFASSRGEMLALLHWAERTAA